MPEKLGPSPLLRLHGIFGGYEAAPVLAGVEFSIGAGEVISLLGRNGMGKTTTLRAILGQLGWLRGSITFSGHEIAGSPPHKISRAGIALAPEGRRVFPNLTVTENLTATAANLLNRPDPWTLDRVFDLLPLLKVRARGMGRALSGGEQQMLAIGRALMTNPNLLILDEATEGLAPTVRTQIWDCLRILKAQGQSILVVDKHVAALGEISDRHVILEKGRVVWQGEPGDLTDQPEASARFLGV